ATVSSDDQTVTDWPAQLTASATITLQVQHSSTTYATFTLSAAPALQGTTWCLSALTCTTDADPDQQLIVQDQRLGWLGLDPAGAGDFSGGVVATVAEPYQLGPGGSRALIVSTASGLARSELAQTQARTRAVDQTLLLFEDGTAGWFASEDLLTFRVAKVGHQVRYERYAFDSDLALHEDWRAGYL